MIRATWFRMPALVLALGAAASFAAPVTQDEAASPTTALPAIDAGSGSDPAASSAAALAAKILEEAQAGASAEEEAASKPRKHAAHPAASAPAAAASAASGAAASAPATRTAARKPEESPLREAAKAAVEWVKDAVPWLRSEGDDDNQPSTPRQAVDWDGSVEGGARGPGGLAGSNLAGAGIGGGGAAGVILPPPKPESSEEVQRQLLRDAIEMFTALISHPMTWLVIALFVIGGYAMGKIDRRPK